MKTNIPDGDYVLEEGAAWIEVKNAAIRIISTDEGVIVDIYKSGEEFNESIAGCYVYDAELEDDDDENS